MFVERLVKSNLSLEKKFKCESLVYHNKTESLKHENCFNVVSEKAHSSNKYNLSHSGPALEPKPSSLFWLMFLSMLHQAGQFRNQFIQPV
jgi:hypothetical protein